jgi:hypothetical protein
MGRALAWCLCLVLIGLSAGATASQSLAADCDTAPTGVETQDYRLHFELPPGTGIRYFHEPPWCELSGGGVALADLLSLRPPARTALGGATFHDQDRADRVDHQRYLRPCPHRHVQPRCQRRSAAPTSVSQLRHAGTTTVSSSPRRATRMPARRATPATCAASSGSDLVVARARASRPLCALLK